MISFITFAVINLVINVSATPVGESIVNIDGVGPVKGLIQEYGDSSGDVYFQYLGIPFSHAGRFEVAQPSPPWTEVYDATVEGKVCPQPTGNIQFPFGVSEDCLVLSVTSPQVSFMPKFSFFFCLFYFFNGKDPNDHSLPLKPVVVFIYGGVFIIGTSHKEFYDPEILVGEGLVVVQPNYRLGSFGWVTDGSIIPKNIALKDVRCALEWVQAHIHEFGGDPNQVTIYGESAGSVIVSTLWHARQRLNNLFHAVFMQSGVVITPWGLQKRPDLAFHNVLVKTRCICTIDQPVEDQVDCLRSLTYAELNIEDLLTLGLNDIAAAGLLSGFNAAVVMEDACDPDAIVIEDPLQQLKNGDIRADMPLMMSITNEEVFTFAPCMFGCITTHEMLSG